MPEEEREVRMAALQHRERKMDVNFWMESFLKNMGSLLIPASQDPMNEDLPTTMSPFTGDDFGAYLSKYIGKIFNIVTK